jgi:hypothetical protein
MREDGFSGELEKRLKGQCWKAGYGDLADWVRTALFATNVSPAPSTADLKRIISRARAQAQGGD